MARHPLSERFHQLLTELGATHDRKQADYGRDDDPFANVRASTEWGMPAWVGAMVRATDKLRRLQQYARTGTLSNEGARDSFVDLAVYALIGLVLWEEGERGKWDGAVISKVRGYAAGAVAVVSDPDCYGCDMDTQKYHNLGCPSRGYVPAA